MKNQLKEYISNLTRGQYFKLKTNMASNRPDLYEFVENSWIYEHEPKNFSEKCYHAAYGISPICQYGNLKKFEYYSSGYKGCGRRDVCQCAQDNYIKSMKDNHGVESPMQSKKIREKAGDSWEKLYGTRNLHEINVGKKTRNL